ncbi:MAG: diaminopimelate decarboxylase [Phycisphaerae bacterium]|nr:diaminopimelate decarboxylase [Phycisphaerae bacterium]
MDSFRYDDGELFGEGVRLTDLAAHVGTPTYVYSAATLTGHYDRLAAAFAPLRPLICYSVKSCSNIHVLRSLAARGCGMDVVSGGELRRARLAGVPGERIVFAGVGKTEREIADALGGSAGAHEIDDAPIAQFNVESEPEYELIASIARTMNARGVAAIRVNPAIEAGHHAYVATGAAHSKFGVPPEHARELIRRFAHEKHLSLAGIHLHLGSSIADTAPFVEAVRKALELIDALARDGVTVTALDLGGGFAADYESDTSPSYTEYAAALVPLLRERAAAGLRIILEPGRTISANAGVLLTRVLYVKLTGPKKYIVCDAGMHTLIRPALYGSFHFVWPAAVAPQHEPPRRAERLDLPGLEPCDVVGPVCESADFLARERPLPPLARGDLLAVFSAGAYGMSMASRYNSHPLPAEVLIDGSRARIIRRRESPEDLTLHEIEPEDVPF